MRETIDINGSWKFRLDRNDLGECYPEELNSTHKSDARWMGKSYDDSRWDSITVPSCWQTEGYDYNGVAWYRRSLHLDPVSMNPENRYQIVFEGINYLSGIWFNGHYLGSHEGYFSKIQYDITHLITEHNTIAVRVEAFRDALGERHEIDQKKTTFKGALDRWDANNTEVSPGGIVGDVYITTTKMLYINQMKVVAIPEILNDDSKQQITADTYIHTELGISHILSKELLATEMKVEIFSKITKERVTIRREDRRLVPGQNTLSMNLFLEDAALWWTWDLGDSALYTMHITLCSDDVIYDSISKDFGIRDLRVTEKNALYLNGIRFFQRGSNYLSDQFLPNMSEASYKKDIGLMIKANLNTVHPFCVVEKDEFYDLCDREGLLVYQDFPVWLMASNTDEFVIRALNQGKELIEHLYNHPSVCIINFGSQASVANVEKYCSALVAYAQKVDPYRVYNYSNSAVIDLESTDRAHPTRSFFWEKEQVEIFKNKYGWREDCHLYAGWYTPEYTDLLDHPIERTTLVTEYGGQSLPSMKTLSSFISDKDLKDINLPVFERRCLQSGLMFSHVPLKATIEELIEDSQTYHAELIKYHTEFYRKHKFEPCNGAHVFQFVDCWPAITWSLIEYDRTPKKAYYALSESMQPLICIIDCDSYQMTSGTKIGFPLIVINDLMRAYRDLRLEITITAPQDEVVGREEVLFSVEPNSRKALSETISIEPKITGNYHIALSITEDDTNLSLNTYCFKSIC